MLPDNEALQNSLNDLEVIEGPAHDNGDLTISSPKESRTHDGQFISERTELTLHQAGGPISARRLADRLADELAAIDHPCSAKRHPARLQVAGALLGLVVLGRSADRSVLDVVNDAIRKATPVRLYSYALLRSKTNTASKHHFGEFTYGRLDLEALRERCKRAGSDYFELYGEKHRDHLAVTRKESLVNMVDSGHLETHERIGRDRVALGYRITEEFYGTIARDAQEQFLLDVDRQQAAYVVAGLGSISSDALKTLIVAEWIHVFTRQERRHGWVSPSLQAFTLETTDPRAYAEDLTRIHERLAISDWGTRPLDEITQRFCEYCMAADALKRHGRLEEAVLYIVFGLDLLLGGESTDQLTAVLSERVAILVHQAIGESVPDVTKFVRDSYNMRSGYAHRGHRGDFDALYEDMPLSDRLDKLERISRAVLAAACFVRRQLWAQSGDTRSNWVARLDILRNKHRAEIPISSDEIADLGLDRVHFEPDAVPAIAVDWSTE